MSGAKQRTSQAAADMIQITPPIPGLTFMRLSWKRTLIGWLVALTLTGCASASGLEEFERRMEAAVGKGTKDQFLTHWGPPLSRMHQDQAEVWLYRRVLLQFDQEGILRAWHYHRE